MSNTVGYSLGCVTPVRHTLTQGDDATGNAVAFSVLGCAPGCWNGDYRDRRYWAQIPVSATVTSGTDYYGALAPTLKFQGGGTYREICPTVCFCEGPVAEGETVVEFLGRYETRWMALLVEGLIYYGKVDGALVQVPLDLFPDPLSDTATHIALSFDANARPVFAYEEGGTIYVRRYVADVPTTYSWTGTNPCLFFNGVVNYDDAQTDVVCYYLTASGGGLYARFQRENFGVANLVLEDPGLDSLMAVDRGRGALASYMVIELSGKRIFAAVYPPWPILAEDATTAGALPVGGSLVRTVFEIDQGTELTLATAAPAGGYHRAVLLPPPLESDASAASATPQGGYHRAVLIPLPTESDPSTSSATPHGGYHRFVLIQAGSYADDTTATAIPQTGFHTHV